MGKWLWLLSLSTINLQTFLYSDAESLSEWVSFEPIKIQLSGEGSVMYFSNPFLLPKEESDQDEIPNTFGTAFTPSVLVELGSSDKDFYLKGEYSYSMRKMDSIDVLDSNDKNYRIHARKRYNRLQWQAEAQSSDFSLPSHESRHLTTVPSGSSASQSFNIDYQFSHRTEVHGGVTFGERKYDNTNAGTFSDQSSFSVPLHYLYGITENLDIGLGTLYRVRKSTIRPTTKDFALHLNLQGELTPRLSADVKIGNLHSNPDQDLAGGEIPTADSLFLSSTIAWKASKNVNVVLESASDRQANAFSEDISKRSHSISAYWVPSRRTTVAAKIRTQQDTYLDSEREEERLGFELSVFHRISESQQLSFHLNRSNNDSSSPYYDYVSTFSSTGWNIQF